MIAWICLLFFLERAQAADGPIELIPEQISNSTSSWLQTSGRIYTDQYFFTRPEATANPLAQSSVSAWLGLDTEAESPFHAHALLQLDAFLRDLNHPDHASAHFQLREGYVSFANEGNDLRIGQQIIPWGKSDGINPTDYFTAKNYTLLNPDDEVKRMGALALNWTLAFDQGKSPFSLQTIVQANYPQTRFIIPNTVIPQGLSINRYPPSPTAFRRSSMEYGMKLAYLQANFDASVSVFHGFAQFPEYVLEPRSLTVNAINPEETAVGADGSFTAFNAIVRFETAVHLPNNGSESDPLFGLVEPSHWDSVVGIEKPVFQNFRFQLQALYRWHLYFTEQAYRGSTDPVINQIQQAIGRANQTLLNYRRRGNPGATFRFSYARDTSNWTADVFLVGYFADGQDFLIRPQVGFTPVQNLKLQAGFDFYGGDPNGPLGALHRQSDAFFEGRYYF